MADKTLDDVVNSLNSINETIKNPPKSTKDVEQAMEAEKSAAEEKGIFQGIYDVLHKGFGAAVTKDKKQGGLIAGLLGGIGAGLGGIGKAVANIGKGFGVGLAALGAGIAGFVLAIGGASMILDLMGTDGTALTAIVTNFFNAFSMENAAKMGVILVIAGALAGFKVEPTRFAIMMTAVGAGIVGFAGGILIGEQLAGFGLKHLGGMDGGALAGLLNSFFGALTPESAAGMGIVVTLAAAAAGLKTSGTKMAGMMTGIGAGISGFAGGILIGSAAAGHALTEMGGIDGSALAGLLNSFFGSMTPETAAGVGIIVTLAAAAGKLNVGGKRMAGMMTGIGAGIAGFAGGILVGSAIAGKGLEAMGALDTTALTSLLQGFFTAITPEIAAGLGIIVTLAGVAAKLKITPVQMALGMTGIGAGIAGFALGVLLGEGAAKLGEMASLDGSALSTLISNFMGAFEGVGFKPLAGLIIAGSVLGAFGPAGAAAAIIGMGAIGAGIAAFMVPLLAADWIAKLGGDNAGSGLKSLLTNIGEGIGGFLGGFAAETMSQMKEIDGDKLAQIGKGILDLGLGMVAFAGGRAAGGLADIAGGIGNAIGSLFGKKKEGPLHMFAEISKDKTIDAKRLSELGIGVSALAHGMASFAAIDSTGLAANALSASLIAGLEPSEKLGSWMGDAAKSAQKMITEKTLNMTNMSEENKLAGVGGGGGGTTNFNNFNTDNSVRQQSTTALAAPASTRSADSTLNALLAQVKNQ